MASLNHVPRVIRTDAPWNQGLPNKSLGHHTAPRRHRVTGHQVKTVVREVFCTLPSDAVTRRKRGLTRKADRQPIPIFILLSRQERHLPRLIKHHTDVGEIASHDAHVVAAALLSVLWEKLAWRELDADESKLVLYALGNRLGGICFPDQVLGGVTLERFLDR